MEKLASLKPLHPEIEGFSITAGNAAGVNDGAAAMVMVERGLAEELGLPPLAVVKAWASAGVPPHDTGLAPTIAIPKALDRAGLTVGDVDLWEINEAFASMCVATTRDPGDRRVHRQCPREWVQPRPPHRHDRAPAWSSPWPTSSSAVGGGTGVAAMCAGGGMSTAVVLEVPAP